MPKRPYLFTIVKALLKRSQIKHTAHYNPFVIRINELQGLPVLYLTFDKEFSGYVSVYDVGSNLSVVYGFYSPTCESFLKKLFRFRLLTVYHLNRFAI